MNNERSILNAGLGRITVMMISCRSLISPCRQAGVPGFKRLKYLIFYINIIRSGLGKPERLILI